MDPGFRRDDDHKRCGARRHGDIIVIARSAASKRQWPFVEDPFAAR